MICFETINNSAVENEPLANRQALAIPNDGRYADSLGWLHPAQWAASAQLDRLARVAGRIRETCDVFILVGVGGSNQGARAVIEALAPQGGPRILYGGNNLSCHEMQCLLAAIKGKKVAINVVAKNFETLEPGAAFRILRGALAEVYGADAPKQIYVTGTPDSGLHRLAKQQGYEFFTFPPDIGGRFSALCDVGLLPMAVAGVDIVALLEGAQAMHEQLVSDTSAQNLAIQYAAFRQGMHHAGYGVEMLAFFEPRLRHLAGWWVQLFGESEGKLGRGLFPAQAQYSEALHSIGQFVQQGAPVLFETFLRVKEPGDGPVLKADGLADGFAYLDGKLFSDLNRAAEASTLEAHSQHFPCGVITMERLDELHLGALIYFFEYACMLSAIWLGVNPFDQPGVEAYKQGMFKLLGKPD